MGGNLLVTRNPGPSKANKFADVKTDLPCAGSISSSNWLSLRYLVAIYRASHLIGEMRLLGLSAVVFLARVRSCLAPKARYRIA